MLLRGEHNIENVLASMAITSKYSRSQRHTGGSQSASSEEWSTGSNMSASVRGIAFFNDSKATNVDSAIKAVASFERNVILILGGRDKGASYAPLVEAMRGKVKHVLLIGEAADKISAAVGIAFPVTRAPSLQDAVKQSASIGQPGDVVLLSPACASFDMFENYEHRGRVFKKAVQELPAIMPKTLKPDHSLFLTTLALVVLGVAMVFSASTVIAKETIRRSRIISGSSS